MKLDAQKRRQLRVQEAASVWVLACPTEAAPVSSVMPRGYGDPNIHC